MLDFSDIKSEERYRTRDGHTAFNLHIVAIGVFKHIEGEVTPLPDSVHASFGVKRMQWQLNGRVRHSHGSTKNGFDLVTKIVE